MTLTEKEKVALRAIAQNASEGCGAKEPKDLHYDNYSWFDRSDITRLTGFSKFEAAGLMSALDEKGLIQDNEGDGTGWALTEKGIDAAQEVWHEVPALR